MNRMAQRGAGNLLLAIAAVGLLSKLRPSVGDAATPPVPVAAVPLDPFPIPVPATPPFVRPPVRVVDTVPIRLPAPPEPVPVVDGAVEVAFDNFESGDLSYESPQGFRWTSQNKGGSDAYPYVVNGVLRIPFAARYPGDSFSEQRFAYPRARALVIGLDVHLPASYVMPATAPNNNKLVRLWAGAYSGTSDHYGMSLVRSGSGGISIAVEGPTGPTASTDRLVTLPFLPGGGDGLFHRFELTVDVPGRSMSLSIDGAQRWAGTLRSGNPGQENNAGYVGGWANSGFQSPTFMEIDNFQIIQVGG